MLKRERRQRQRISSSTHTTHEREREREDGLGSESCQTDGDLGGGVERRRNSVDRRLESKMVEARKRKVREQYGNNEFFQN
jgi:hypothetical protein